MPPTRRPLAAALIATFALVVAGCVTESRLDLDPSPDAEGATEFFQLSATECVEAGFVAIYPMPGGSGTLAGVWEQDDVREEVGQPVTDGLGTPSPLLLPQNGNWHLGFNCRSATVDGVTQEPYIFGWVGQQIKAPAWDPGGADRHILVSGLGFGNGTIADKLRAATTADITHAARAEVLWEVPKELPRSYAYAIWHDTEKGTYESWSTMAYYRDVPERVVRFWWQVPSDGSQAHIWDGHHAHAQPEDMTWNPVYWDLHTLGGPQYTTPPVDGVEVGAHNFEAVMGPHTPPYQPMLQNHYEHAGLTFTTGKIFHDVELENLWAH